MSNMTYRPLKHIDDLIKRYPELKTIKRSMLDAYMFLEQCYVNEGKVLIAGNGGSAADSEHIVGELMKGFKRTRELDGQFIEHLINENYDYGSILSKKLQGALPAISLNGHPALFTACMNDCDPELCFAQQINGYGKKHDVFWGISTSGNSKNIIYAAITARAKGLKVISLTGKKSNKLELFSDVCIKVPEEETYKIQELHLPVYHCLCMMLEDRFFGD